MKGYFDVAYSRKQALFEHMSQLGKFSFVVDQHPDTG